MAERPVECSGCQKKVFCIYKEIAGGSILESEMCKECPILEQRLHGASIEKKGKSKLGEKGLFCGSCGTSLESIKMGGLLGCSECYAVFAETLIQELMDMGKLPKKMQKKTLHIGKLPSETADVTLSSRLTTLNEALNEAVKKENYEQAAWIRDQIKELTDKPHDQSK